MKFRHIRKWNPAVGIFISARYSFPKMLALSFPQLNCLQLLTDILFTWIFIKKKALSSSVFFSNKLCCFLRNYISTCLKAHIDDLNNLKVYDISDLKQVVLVINTCT
jgi:hypothetical protein